MRTIGLIGGMSWESTLIYYRHLNELTRTRLGGLHSARLVLWSFDFAEIEPLQAEGNWDVASQRLVEAARILEAAGAECIVLCTNTMHRLAPEIEAAVNIPLLHIVDATARAISDVGTKKPLLLATNYTIEHSFYLSRLRERHGIEVRLPGKESQSLIDRIIYNELCRGIFDTASKAMCLKIIEHMADLDIDSVIFGCTEIGMLIDPEDVDIPVFDTARIHVQAALDFALRKL